MSGSVTITHPTPTEVFTLFREGELTFVWQHPYLSSAAKYIVQFQFTKETLENSNKSLDDIVYQTLLKHQTTLDMIFINRHKNCLLLAYGGEHNKHHHPT